MNKQRIPQSDSVRELAHFWDTHDVTAFENELEQISEPVFERKSVLKVHLRADEAEAVIKLARSKGI